MLSSERISVCRSSPEEMWITRPVAIKSYKPKRPIEVEWVSTLSFYKKHKKYKRW
jgi:hypothetical protein